MSSGERQRSAGSADGATVAQAGSVIEADIGSTDWFDDLFFTTKARRHKEKPDAPPEKRLIFNREDREGREAGNRP